MATDPMAALSSASCCAQFVDYASLMISGSLEICKSPDGELIDHSHLEGVANRLLVLSSDIQIPNGVSSHDELVSVEEELTEFCEECSNISDQLLSALVVLQFHGRKEKWASIRHALRSRWNQEQIDALQERLDTLRRRLVTNILVSLRYFMHSISVSSAGKPSTNLVTGASAICIEFLNRIEDGKRWRTDLISEIHGSHFQDVNNTLRALSAKSSISSSQDKVLDFAALVLAKLRFPGAEERYEWISNAQERTFEWIYNDPVVDFIHWLEMESTPYWITGQPGSGKSTLMKFIRKDQRTQDCLIKWAAPKKLVTAAFFFWKSGTEMQMSQTGLLQSLLFEALSQCQDLVAHVFPAHWEAYLLFGDSIDERWTQKVLVRALKRLLKESSSTVKFCFWVDGVDEFRGDPVGLTELFTNVLCSQCQVKLCVSSRPWAAFEDAFGRGRKLSLQDLTRPDIQHFVTSRLCTNSIFHQMQLEEPNCAIQLRDGIVLKASGIFLWVELVLRSLLAGLTYGDRISDLKRRLDSLPPDLDDLITKILSSLDSFYFEQAAQLFQLVRASFSPPTLLSLCLADEEKLNFHTQCEKRFLNHEEMKFMVETMKRRVTSRCKGLLEMTPNYYALVKRPSPNGAERAYTKEDVLQANFKVKYLHRTVQDLLERADNWEKFTAATGKSFSPNEALCKSFIIQLKVLHPRYLMPYSFWQIIAFCIEHFARAERESGTTQVDLLDELDHAAIGWTQRPGPYGFIFVHFVWQTEASAKYHWTSTLATDWTRSVGGPAASTFLAFAVRCQLYSYVQARLSHGSSDVVSSLLYTAVNDYRISLQDAPSCQVARPNIKLIELLLAHGADTNALFRGISAWERVLEQSSKASLKDETLWQAIRNLFIRYGADLDKASHLKKLRHQQRPLFLHNPYLDEQQARHVRCQSNLQARVFPPTPTSQSSSESRASPLPSGLRFSNAEAISGYYLGSLSPPLPSSLPSQAGNMSQQGPSPPARARVQKRIRLRVRKSSVTESPSGAHSQASPTGRV